MIPYIIDEHQFSGAKQHGFGFEMVSRLMSNVGPSTNSLDRPESRPHGPFSPQVRSVGSVPFVRVLRRAFSIFRVGPLLNPGAAFARWRSQRALRAASRAARDSKQKRDWQSKFHLNGLTWHHLYIAQDLRRIQLFLRELHRIKDRGAVFVKSPTKNSPRVTPEAQVLTLVRLERAFSFLLDNVYGVYNSLEKQVLFPWIEAGVQDGAALQRALQLFSKERDHIEDQADLLQSRFARLVCSTGYPYASMGPCSASRSFSATRIRREKRQREAADARALGEALKNGGGEDADEISRRRRSSLFIRKGYEPSKNGSVSSSKASVLKNGLLEQHVQNWSPVPADEIWQLSADLQEVIDDSERLHKMERKTLYPLIAKTFSEREQGRITHVLVYSMRSALAKFMISVYHQAVDKHGSRSQWRRYKREVPLPIRVYTSVWRARLYDGTPLGWLRRTPLKDVSNGEVTAP